MLKHEPKMPDTSLVLEKNRELEMLMKELVNYINYVKEQKTRASFADLLQARECAISYDKVIHPGEGREPIVYSWSNHPRASDDYKVDQTFYQKRELEEYCQLMKRRSYRCYECKRESSTKTFDITEYQGSVWCHDRDWCPDCYVEAMLNSNP